MNASTIIANPNSKMALNNRVVALIDMDCFYVQVEERDDPSIKGKPAAVVQYNSNKGGMLLAVSYEARAKGIKRDRWMRGDEAKTLCPELILVQVPEVRGKADLTKYRNAGQEVIKVLCDFCKTVERASVDEAYIDLTEIVESRLASSDTSIATDPATVLQSINLEYLDNCFIVPSTSTSDNESELQGQDHSAASWLEEMQKCQMIMTDMQDVKLLLGAEIVGQMRKAILEKTSFRCSAGIAHNKVLAKLACGINKPNKQTIIAHSSVPELFKKTKIHKLRNFGGKLGDVLVEQFSCEVMSDLLKVTEKELVTRLGSKCGTYVYQIARGFDDEVVTSRQLPKSVGCNKMFSGSEALRSKDRIRHWLVQLGTEVVERLERDLVANKRRAKSLTLHVKFESQNANHLSKSCGTHVPYNAEKMAAEAMAVMDKLWQANNYLPVVNLGLIASKFEDEDDISNCSSIKSFFKAVEHGKPAETVIPSSCSTKTSSSVPQNSTHTVPIDIENNDSNSADSKSKGFFNRNPSPKKKNPGLLRFASLKSQSPKKDTAAQSSSSVGPGKTNNGNTNESAHSNNQQDGGESSTQSGDAFRSFSKECERCHKSIPVWDFVCHMDWHMAKDLQREINGLPPPPTSPIMTRSKSPNKSSKRPAATKASKTGKTKRGRTSKSNELSGMKTLDNYFASQNQNTNT